MAELLLLYHKNKLRKVAHNMDVLYTIKDGREFNEELIYSLRSLINIPHDRVFIVGGFPSDIKKSEIIHIPTEQKSTKWRNSTSNLKTAILDDRLSDDFIYMNDDFFILKPISEPVKELNLHFGTMAAYYDRLAKKHAETPYMRGMLETSNLLINLGIKEPLSYELHIPFVFNKKHLKQMFSIKGIDNINVLHKRSLYGNLYLKNSKFHSDVKIHTDKEFDTNKCDKFLSTNDLSFIKIRPFLEAQFNKKSKYEI